MGKSSRIKKRHLLRALSRVRGEAGDAEYLPVAQKPSLWDEALAADTAYRSESTNEYTFNSIARGLRKIGEERKEWCGIPMPLSGERLVVEERNPWAAGMAAADLGRVSPRPNLDRAPRRFECSVDDANQPRVRNTFWSWRWRSDITVYELAGKIVFTISPGVHHFGMDLRTLGCVDAWSLETEMNALKTLRGLITHHHFRQYVLTGMFIESSKRSSVKYVFRQLRPTLALGTHKDGDVKCLAALCLHPIAYYEGSWAGAMCPTDDIIAHLMLMRGDEKMFWRRANQHPAYRPEAGL